MTDDDPVGTLRRWTISGAVWRVLRRTKTQVTVGLCRCDGGEEVERITSSDPDLLAFVGDRTTSEQPQPRAIRIARAYDPPTPDGGARILVDRLWPRGIRKADAALDEWCKDVAPSTELRRWYGHEPDRFGEFARRYRAELAVPAARGALTRIAERAEHETVTLLTASKAVEISDAAVLRDVIADLPS